MSCCVQLTSMLLQQVNRTTAPSMCIMVSLFCIKLLVNEVAMQAQGTVLPYALGQIYAIGAHKKKALPRPPPPPKKKSPREKGLKQCSKVRLIFVYLKYLQNQPQSVSLGFSTEEKK